MPNPQHEYVIQIYTHLEEVHMEDSNNKEFSKVHVILGASEYVNIKTKKYIKVRQKGEQIAEYTAFGRAIIAGGK